MFDLILKGGRVIDPAQNLDEKLDIAFADGKIAAIGHNLGDATDARDVTGRIVTPGLIDLHTHVYWGGTSLGVDPDSYAKFSGCTTLIDAGSAGPGNIHGFRKHVIEAADVRILPFLNVSFAGIFGLHWDLNVGECTDLRLLNPRTCLRVAKEQSDLVVGIKVRVGFNTSEHLGAIPMQIALEVADHAGLPLMGHLDNPPPPRTEVMRMLRKGDILTHCFRPWPNAPAASDGGVEEDVLEARARGVIFDIGVRRPPHLHRRSRLQHARHHVEIPQARHVPERRHPCQHHQPRPRHPPARPRHSQTRPARRRHHPGPRKRQLHLPRRPRRTSPKQRTTRMPRDCARWEMVAWIGGMGRAFRCPVDPVTSGRRPGGGVCP